MSTCETIILYNNVFVHYVCKIEIDEYIKQFFLMCQMTDNVVVFVNWYKSVVEWINVDLLALQ